MKIKMKKMPEPTADEAPGIRRDEAGDDGDAADEEDDEQEEDDDAEQERSKRNESVRRVRIEERLPRASI
jgi:hypothetical protein